jgi:RNA polymerase sigma-70 factor (ECF subfamily)
VQETLITVIRKITWLSEPRLFRPWTFRIASRQAFRHLRKERKYGPHDHDEMLLEALPATDWVPPEEALGKLLENDLLSAASRAVLVLHFQEGMTLAEVAAVLEIPIGTAKSRLAYGLKVLRGHFGVKHVGAKKES